MHSTAELLQLYERHFGGVKLTQIQNEVYDSIHYFISQKGKRIRPLLVLASCEMFNGNISNAMDTAFGIELFHNFTLVHDDIIDEALIRRGEPTVHAKYGDNNAILAGDTILIFAYQYLCKNTTGDQLKEILNLFNKTGLQIIEGQKMDIDFEKRKDVTEEEYLKMIEYKTSVLLAACLRIGATLATATEAQKKLIYNFGLYLGLAFQIKDDWLDTFGSGDVFGKRIGGDIIQNKKTYLFIKAWQIADEKIRQRILELINVTNEGEKITDMLSIYEELGVNQHTKTLMYMYYEKALKCLDEIDIETKRKTVLVDFAGSIYNRDH